MVVLGVVGAALFAVPAIGLVSKVAWGDVAAILTSQLAVESLRLSLISSLAATGLSALFGIPLAWILARVDFRGRRLLRGLVLLPLVLPPVVGGAALLFSLGRSGLIGEVLYETTGFILPFSLWGVVIATTFVSMPFLVITVEGALRNLDDTFENAAATLGARRWRVLFRVTLPLVAPSLVLGLILTWARALGEFGATITFAGNLMGRTQTLPLAIFVTLESNRAAAVTLSLVMVVVALAVLVGLRGRWWGNL